MEVILNAFSQFGKDFYQNLIFQDRWLLLLKGTCVTIEITIAAILLGSILGVIFAFMKMSKSKWFNIPANIYIDIIRGTPTVVQLLIIYFIIFGSVSINKIIVAIIAFGLNSGAYVAEIVRAGILAVDKGQTEAGRSLGLNNFKTMTFIVMPQAIKNILPTYASEFIVLLKETAIVGYIALDDLTRNAYVIRSITFNAFFPLITIAIIYLSLTTMLSKVFSALERRMRASDSH